MFVPLPTDVPSQDFEDTGEDIYSVKRHLKKQERRRQEITCQEHQMQPITMGRQDTTMDEVNFDQVGKFPYGSRCYR